MDTYIHENHVRFNNYLKGDLAKKYIVQMSNFVVKFVFFGHGINM